MPFSDKANQMINKLNHQKITKKDIDFMNSPKVYRKVQDAMSKA